MRIYVSLVLVGSLGHSFLKRESVLGRPSLASRRRRLRTVLWERMSSEAVLLRQRRGLVLEAGSEHAEKVGLALVAGTMRIP